MSNKNYRVYKDWNMFDDKILNYAHLNDCNDTIHGVCESTETVEECIDMCENSIEQNCDRGYFISSKEGNICVPLRSYIYGETYPYYRLVNKNSYEELKNVNTTYFIRNTHPFPPYVANLMFYQDHFILRNVNTGAQIALSDDNQVEFSNKDGMVLQFLPVESARTFLEKYIVINNEDKVVINIPTTSMILRKEGNYDDLVWSMKASIYWDPQNLFVIHSIKNIKKGEPLNYDDKFYFTYAGQLVVYDETQKILKTINKSVKEALQDNDNILFDLSPRVEVFYCENEECKSVDLSKCERIGSTATYNGIKVDRNSECWELCKKENKKSKNYFLYFFIGLLFFIFFIFLYRLKKYKK